jgi:hypothetical protein
MNDEELVALFESAELPGEQFSHEEHVRVAWWYLRGAPLPEALGRFSAALRRYAAAHGVPGKYHETITIASMLLIAERLGRDECGSWEAFARRNADLLSREPSILARYYTAETLSSPEARRTFVMPDRLA